MTPSTDKHERHFQQQLSAMLDGELPPDQAKFMLRRLQHDAELAACWERWQICGDMLRGRHDTLLPSDFSQRVADAIARDTKAAESKSVIAATQAPRRLKWARWGGGAALAASVAMAALFVGRQPADVGSTAPVQVVAGTSATPATATANPANAAVDTESGISPLPTVLSTIAVVAEVPRRTAERRSRAQSQRAASRVRRQSEAPIAVAVNARASGAAAPQDDNSVVLSAGQPAAQPIDTPRPWPRATLPDFPTDGVFSVGYGDTGAAQSRHPFYPFEPRVELLTTSTTTSAPVPSDEPGGNAPR